jgi:hypothetical protein
VHAQTGVLAVAALLLAACGDAAKLPEQQVDGPNPTLPAPNKTLLPTVNVAPATQSAAR